MNNTRLILIAHGSRDPRWRIPFEKLTEVLKRDLGENNIRLAYMQFVTPTIEEAVEEASRDGMMHIKALPLFMSGGGHVDRDIPEEIKKAQAKFPGLKIDILPSIGENPGFFELMRRIAKESL